jgi:hypothetical protein
MNQEPSLNENNEADDIIEVKGCLTWVVIGIAIWTFIYEGCKHL